MSLFVCSPNKVATDGHHHEEQEEAYVVIRGPGRIKLDDDRVELNQFDVVRVAPHVVRAFEAGPKSSRSSRSAGSGPTGA